MLNERTICEIDLSEAGVSAGGVTRIEFATWLKDKIMESGMFGYGEVASDGIRLYKNGDDNGPANDTMFFRMNPNGYAFDDTEIQSTSSNISLKYSIGQKNGNSISENSSTVYTGVGKKAYNWNASGRTGLYFNTKIIFIMNKINDNITLFGTHLCSKGSEYATDVEPYKYISVPYIIFEGDGGYEKNFVYKPDSSGGLYTNGTSYSITYENCGRWSNIVLIPLNVNTRGIEFPDGVYRVADCDTNQLLQSYVKSDQSKALTGDLVDGIIHNGKHYLLCKTFVEGTSSRSEGIVAFLDE